MKASALMAHWEQEYGDPVCDRSYPISLNVKDAARVEALLEMFPGLSQERLLRDLVHAALNDLASGFPYVAGDTVIARDEEGFPVYEDIGPTPEFLELTRKHLEQVTADKH
ncbi:type 1 pili tip component [Oceanobacter antarcticus]|jgi:hypothetical protein|uniref:Type 1 pili tip component n=1 Tax=Oceanobacter antarcticus TaxID=3133425 RepID=A0ABW8NLE8_9GAMM